MVFSIPIWEIFRSLNRKILLTIEFLLNINNIKAKVSVFLFILQAILLIINIDINKNKKDFTKKVT